jgi:hypothetical protein
MLPSIPITEPALMTDSMVQPTLHPISEKTDEYLNQTHLHTKPVTIKNSLSCSNIMEEILHEDSPTSKQEKFKREYTENLIEY